MLAEGADEVFKEPLVIARDGTVVDGRARLTLARLQGRTTLPCIEYDLTEAQALEKLIQTHRRSNGLNDFSRIVLALDLEPELKEKARQNQSLGGQNKGWSNLTTASRLDVRSEIARIAGVSAGNVTKVKQIVKSAPPEVIRALRESDVSIHHAWSWSELLPQHQKSRLWEHQSRKGVQKKIRELISRHQGTPSRAPLSQRELSDLLLALQSDKLAPVSITSVAVPGRAIFVTEELLKSLEPLKELALICATSTP
jgi:ParB-like chromosome segregation protein Spo0J